MEVNVNINEECMAEVERVLEAAASFLDANPHYALRDFMFLRRHTLAALIGEGE